MSMQSRRHMEIMCYVWRGWNTEFNQYPLEHCSSHPVIEMCTARHGTKHFKMLLKTVSSGNSEDILWYNEKGIMSRVKLDELHQQPLTSSLTHSALHTHTHTHTHKQCNWNYKFVKCKTDKISMQFVCQRFLIFFDKTTTWYANWLLPRSASYRRQPQPHD